MASTSSLRRRRGTKSKRSGGFLGNPIRILFVLALFLCSVLGSLFLLMSAEEKKTPVDSFRHKVQAVPEMLRGKAGEMKMMIPGKHRETTTTTEHNSFRGGAQHGDVSSARLNGADLDLDHVIETARNAGEPRHVGAAHHPVPVKTWHSNKNAGAGGGSNNNNNIAVPTSTTYPYPLEPTRPDYDIHAEYQVLGGHRFTEYTTGESPYEITDALRQQSDTVARSRRDFVKRAMQHAWNNGYVKYAFGQDEVLPQSKSGSNGWGGHGVTLVDSLDTLWLMDMKDEFWRARDWVRDHLVFTNTGHVSVFETTIRDLGGLLSAYDLSGDQTFLDHALALGSRLIKAFDGSNTGIPFGQVDLRTGAVSNIGWTGSNAIFSEFGTTQIENRYLSKMTGEADYARKTERVFEILNEISPASGLFPYYFRNSVRDDGKKQKLKNGELRPEFTNDKITFGAMADSTYEYMLKIWIQGGKKEPMYREMYDKAMDGMHNELLQTSSPSGLTYIADKNSGRMDHKMDHLVCFMGGLLALGAYTDPNGLSSPRAQRDLKTAKALTYTCYQMYARMNTGIAAEFVQFSKNNDFAIGRGAPHYLLRPETVESFFVLNQLTGDPVYREWGWEVFQSIEKYCKTDIAYGALSNVQDVNPKPRDKMESFFLAETLKYLYLLMDPDTEIDVLHKHVFNTEAHPLRVFPLIDEEARQA